MKNLVLLFLFSFNLYLFAYSGDTLEKKIQTEVIVESTKDKDWKVSSLSYDKLTIDNKNLSVFNSTTKALSYLPNVYIRDYGGIGGIKTISLRGFSANDVGILLDGDKVNNQQNGVIDLNLLPIDLFEEIELVRGGSSFILGNNSTAGFVNLSFQKSSQRSISLSYGSFEQIKMASNFPFKLSESLSGGFAVNYFYALGNYPFKINEFGQNKITRRENSKSSNISLLSHSKLYIQKILMKINFLFTQSERGVPGAVLQNSIENKNAKLFDNFFLGSLKFNPFIIDSNIQVNLKLLIHNSKYYDPDLNLLLIKKENANYQNQDFAFRFNYQKNFTFFQTRIHLELNQSNFEGDFLEKIDGKTINRTNSTLGLGINKTLEFNFFKINSETNFRFDAFSDFEPVLLYSLGLTVEENTTKTGAKLNISRNYRLPTFNEMYFLNYGNLHLKPEDTYSFNIEFYNHYFTTFHPKITFFLYFTKDKIVSVPKSPVQWTALNIAKTQSNGFEISFLNKNKIFETTFSISFTNAVDKTDDSPTYNKQLIYTPKLISNFVMHFPLTKGFSTTIKGFYVGQRFALPDNSFQSKLADYFLLDLSLVKEIVFHNSNIFISFEVSNILNIDYQIILNYPMPRRYFLLTFKYLF
ncbi:TonB-dependent receptor [Bacteroidetes/Chlorobi group bacterium Naka2016]|jgi:outer membrane cobalamin receptor|nr:MAG: TonB-dependent receptor [Bacteroidetes/Chlorobi group bacterium Naka2016]